MSWWQATVDSLQHDWEDIKNLWKNPLDQATFHKLAVDLAAGEKIQEDQIASMFTVIKAGLPQGIKLTQQALAIATVLGWTTVPALAPEINALNLVVNELVVVNDSVAAGDTN